MLILNEHHRLRAGGEKWFLIDFEYPAGTPDFSNTEETSEPEACTFGK